MTAEEPLVVVDDDQVRVTTWSFGRVGDTTGPHVHEYDHIVVPVPGGAFTSISADGASRD